MNIAKLFAKLHRRIDKFLYVPIEVFVIHAVSDKYDADQNLKEDWIETQCFFQGIDEYCKEYKFIAIDDAYRKLRKDVFRKTRYAVLTCDDGYSSILSILPMLEKLNIPITLFINPKYLDGVSKRNEYTSAPQYISGNQLCGLTSRNITIGLHGWEHNDVTKMTESEFEESVVRSVSVVGKHPRYVPFYAYTWGCHTDVTDRVLDNNKLVPVYCDGSSMYKYHGHISRRVFCGMNGDK